MKMITLEHVPTSVFWFHIIPHLSPKEIGALKGVSKTLCSVVNEMLPYKAALMGKDALLNRRFVLHSLSYYFNYCGGVYDHDFLVKATKQGDSSLVKWLCSRFRLSRKDIYDSEALQDACKGGHIDIVQWLCKHFEMTIEDLRFKVLDCVDLCCINSRVDIVKWFCEYFDFKQEDIRYNDNSALQWSCHGENPVLFKWLCVHFDLTIDDVRANDHFILVSCCEKNNLVLARWIVKRYPLTREDARANYNRALYTACNFRAFEMLKWLVVHFRLTADDIIANGSTCALSVLCHKGYFRMVKWACRRFNTLNIVHVFSYAFLPSCLRGHLEITKWLCAQFKISGVDIRRQQNAGFRWSCEMGHLETAKWLCDTYGILASEVERYDDDTFRQSCINGHLHVAKWICERFGFPTEYVMDSDLLLDVCKNSNKCNNVEVVQWLYETFEMNSLKFATVIDYIRETKHCYELREWFSEKLECHLSYTTCVLGGFLLK